MRRSMHSLIVALLCLTLFVDSAKACWRLRHHRSRAHACRPAACRTPSPLRCNPAAGEIVVLDAAVEEVVFQDDPAGCLCGGPPVEHGTVVYEAEMAQRHTAAEQTVEHGTTSHEVIDRRDAERRDLSQPVVDQAAAAPADAGVVVHGPTIVVDAAPSKKALDADPKSVVAQPMPIAAAGPAELPKPTSAEEPIPDLKPAIAPAAPVAPVSNEQPSPKPAAQPESPATAAAVPTPPKAAEHEAVAPMPAPANDLAGAPDVTSLKSTPKEPNLFDLYADEGDEEVAFGDAPAADDTTPEPAQPKQAPADAEATEEPEMAEEEATEDASTSDSEEKDTSAPADEEAGEADADADAPGEDASEEEPGTAPKDDAAPTEPDPLQAAFAVPDAPIRRWSDDTGTHHAQGWLVEVRADSVRILKVNGRHTTVARESLSAVDREYVSAVGERLAAERPSANPAPTATAGL